jgi:hypothetical protein
VSSSLPEPTPVTPLHPSFTSPLLLATPLTPSTPLSPLSVQGLNASIPGRASAIPGMQDRHPGRRSLAWQCRARAGCTGGLQLGHHVNCLWRCSGLALQRCGARRAERSSRDPSWRGRFPSYTTIRPERNPLSGSQPPESPERSDGRGFSTPSAAAPAEKEDATPPNFF